MLCASAWCCGRAANASSPFRPLTQATPVPAWVAPAGHILLAAPVLAVTCWAQLRIMTHTVPPQNLGHPAAVYPVIAQLTGWSVVTVAAACVDRSRYADLGGAIAAPVSFAAIALAWYAVASAALALTCVAMRDRWHRHTRNLHRRRRLFVPRSR